MQTNVIAIANQKGGVGKTTTAVNLAACLAERGRKVLLIDLDPQANATSGLGFAKEIGASLYSALIEGRPAASAIQATDYKNLDLIPSEIDLAGCEVEIARMDGYLHRLRTVLRDLIDSGTYHYVLLDCSPSLGILTMNVLTAAHSVVIPIQCEYYALEGLSVMTRLIDQLRESGTNPGLEVEGILMTMYDMRTNLSQQVVKEVIAHYGDKVYETLIPRNVRLGEAPSFGKPIIAYNSYCTGSAAYRQFTREFLERRRDESKPELSIHLTERADLAGGLSFVPASGASLSTSDLSSSDPARIHSLTPEEVLHDVG
jgi:chromosome partitioning protein